MPLNTIIREKRKELGLTQEQIAKCLGVSAPAVNKWEKGATYPDVSLLPALARLLKTDLNTLFCFHDGLTPQEINSFCIRLSDTLREQGLARGFAMAREKTREYPACAGLLHLTAMTLQAALIMSGKNTEEKEPYEEQIIELYQQAARYGDTDMRSRSLHLLASKYISRREYEKAQEVLDQLPEAKVPDKRELQAQLYAGQDRFEEAAQLLERKLLDRINEVQMLLMYLADIEGKGGHLENAAFIGEVSRQSAALFQLWDYYAYLTPLEAALARKDAKESIPLLESILSSALTWWNPGDSPLYRCIPREYDPEVLAIQIQSMLPPLLSELENSPKYAFLKTNTQFQQLIKRYKSKCRNKEEVQQLIRHYQEKHKRESNCISDKE